jgi:hypothetical protein
MSVTPAESKIIAPESPGAYQRYHIHTRLAPDIEKWPSRFKVHVGKGGLAKLLLTELVHYRGRLAPVMSRPCMYGVFSGPVGGFAPREHLCVGCLRCTTEFPQFVRVEHNMERRKLGDSFFTFNYVDSISYEASTGLIPVKGAGYRGKFGGEGWDGMWTDMSEIVRPTRDGIHGREFISTVVDIGYTPNFLLFDENHEPYGAQPKSFSIPLPMLFDASPNHSAHKLAAIFSLAADHIGTLAILPFDKAVKLSEFSESVAPVLRSEDGNRLDELSFAPRLIEMQGWDQQLFDAISERFPDSIIALRTGFETEESLLRYFERGVRVFHLLADLHGRSMDGRFVLDLIRSAHKRFVEAGVREEVTLIGSGGIIAAEHVAKAILCGLDAVALDTPLLVALQAKFSGECVERGNSSFTFPDALSEEWGVQRLKNLAASWRDQLLEILGAMGLREVRRLRGEMGRAMFMRTLEAEAFAGIEGYSGGNHG